MTEETAEETNLQNNPNKEEEEYEEEITSVSTFFAGPLPHPNILQGYENIQTGFADRILKMAEIQTSHRQDLEKSVMSSNIANERKGMWFAFIVTMSLMIFGFYLISHETDAMGYLVVFAPAIFHAGNYIYNRKREEEKLKTTEGS